MMVRQGAFSVQLVDATTKEPFREHLKSDGTHYVEVEPNVEYWVRVKNHRPESQRCWCSITVDGHDLGLVNLGVLWYLWGDFATQDCGVWSVVNQVETTKALRVKLLDGSNDGDPFFIGNVKVAFYEVVADGVFWRKFEDSNSTWSEAEVASSSANGKKAVVSSTGTTAKLLKHVPREQTKYVAGKLLETVTLHYCTCAGLIHAGVLVPGTRGNRHSVASTSAPARLVVNSDQAKSQHAHPNVSMGHNSMLNNLIGQDNDSDDSDDSDDDSYDKDSSDDDDDDDAGNVVKPKASSVVSTNNPLIGKLHATLERPESAGSSTVLVDQVSSSLYGLTGDLDDDDASSDGADNNARSKKARKSESLKGLVYDLTGCDDGVGSGADTPPHTTIIEDLESVEDSADLGRDIAAVMPYRK